MLSQTSSGCSALYQIVNSSLFQLGLSACQKVNTGTQWLKPNALKVDEFMEELLAWLNT
jgi:hypothetical protein